MLASDFKVAECHPTKFDLLPLVKHFSWPKGDASGVPKRPIIASATKATFILEKKNSAKPVAGT
jgi:hypothetical protein